MPETASPTAETVLRNYFHAKDENRPHRLAAVFSADARLEIRNHTDAIAFPAFSEGREALADVLVRSFGQQYENVYSFYLARPAGEPRSFACGWLVAMTEKASRSARLGCGRYLWEFAPPPSGLALRLVIDIDAMQVLPPAAAPGLFAAIAALGYPWSSPAEVAAVAERHPLLAAVARRIALP